MSMIIYNCTFMLDKALCTDFIQWLNDVAIPVLTHDRPDANPRLTSLIDVPGDPEFNTHALSYALQLEFENLEAARHWADTSLLRVIGMYNDRFGPGKALVFTTILQEIPLGHTNSDSNEL